MNRLLRAAALGLVLLSSGCYRMTIVNGREPAAAPVVEDRWRSATVLDAFPVDSPLRLDAECKEAGWSKIRQERSVLDWFVDVFLAGVVYESTHVDVYCAKAGAGQGAPVPTSPGAPSAPSPPVSAPKSTDL